ncbi:MAG TPA: TauD/TfdA family dioxygenase [Caulobacteraceae bacterium]|nr:TauD/TfdA family dioxygenase [Caulobacteraceae bacterium]
MNTAVDVRVRPLKPGFGAEILDVDLASADRPTLDAVVDTFHRHGAIMLRGQTMNPTQLVDFIANFGEPEDHTLKEFCVPGHPKVYTLSNRIVDGKPIGAHNDGVGWHTDYSYKPEPVMATMLYAVEVPAEGSDTLLADCVAAWNALSPERQQELEGLVLHHSYQHFMSTREYGARELTDEQKADNPDVFHPLVRTHPADGRKALWPSTGTVIEVMGLPNPQGLDLVQELVDHVTQDRFVHRHKWQVGDILMWDNRCTLHTGTLFDDTRYIREMHRLWVKGDKPY